MKTDTGLKTLNVTRKENYLIVQLDRGKANVLNQEMIDELRELIQVEEENEETGGIILNGKPHFFSGGVDLLEVYYYDSEAIRNFWGSFIELSSEMLARHSGGLDGRGGALCLSDAAFARLLPPPPGSSVAFCRTGGK